MIKKKMTDRVLRVYLAYIISEKMKGKMTSQELSKEVVALRNVL
jgi:hypothetical protein